MPRPNEFDPRPDPPLTFVMQFTADELAHVFMGIANYQAYRDQDPAPEVEILTTGHPLVRMQTQIVGQIDDLIATGMMHGWDVRGLLEVKEAIAGAATAAEESSGDGD